MKNRTFATLTVVAALSAVITGCGAAGTGPQGSDQPRSSPDNNTSEFDPRRVLAHPLPAITNAPFMPAAEATDTLVHGGELVLGVVVRSQPRAYPINMLTGPEREIINDTLGGQSIAATW